MLKTWLSALTLSLLSANAVGNTEEVPVDLPNQEAIDAYKRYQTRPGYSAFAVSQLGTWGESWSYGLIAAAEDAAIADCEAKQPKGYCYVVSVDGESVRDTISVNALLERIEASKNIQWQPVASHEVPIQIANNTEQMKAYQDYTKALGYKAYAATHTGEWGVSIEQSTNDLAQYHAIKNCEEKSASADNCKIIDQNNVAPLGRIAVAALKASKEEVAEVTPPALNSTLRDKDLARPFFGDRWDEYQNAERNKAFAANRAGAVGLAYEHVNSLVAEEAAISACEHFHSFRLRKLDVSEQDKECYVVAVNNFYDADVVKELSEGTK